MKYLSFLLCGLLVAIFSLPSAHAQNTTRAKKIDIPTANYELCLGNTVVPKATFSNVSTSAVNIKAQLLIVNVVTGIRVYGDTVDVMNLGAGADITVTFDTFKTNPNILSQLGTFNVLAIGPAMNANKVIVGDALSADDTIRSVMFGLRRTAHPFGDYSNNYSMAAGLAIPDQHKWLSVGATVVEGDDYTFDPPSPRDPDVGYGSLELHSPLIKLDRKNQAGAMYTGTANGDTLSSYPINLQGVTKMNLSFDYHRSSKRLYGGFYDTVIMYGAESTLLNASGGITRRGDSLILEFKKPSESGCQPAANGWNQIAAFDGGKDMEFQRFSMRVESKNIGGLNYFNPDFRFRLRLKAKADQPLVGNAVDDEDAWYIDNVHLSSPRLPEFRINWVRVVSPYTKVPASQAIFPVYAKIANNAVDSYYADAIVQILGPDGQTKYFHKKRINVSGLRDTIVRFPDWDARGTMITAGKECKVHAWFDPEWFDYDGDNNYAYSTFFLNAEHGTSQTHEFAYDDAGISPLPNSGNDWPALTRRQGQGMGFNNSSGSYAMRVKLMKRDTLYGVRAYFGNGNAANDPIRISVYEGSDSSNVPGSRVSIQGIESTFQNERRGSFFNQFWPYYFPKAIVLPGVTDSTDGVYWLSVSQLGLDNMMLGADLLRSGFDWSRTDTATQFVHRSPYGTQYTSTENAGDISNAFAFQVPADTGAWLPLLPKYASRYPFAWQGTFHYTPMIRALFGRQSEMKPVEYAKPLAVSANDNAALLTWTTATETNNRGFIVQRLASGEEWQRIGFVASRSSNSSTPNGYSYVDWILTAGTYRYRLAQVDLDGSESISNTAEVTILHGDALVTSFWPNPFNPTMGATSISVDPSIGDVKVTIVNALGQTVRSMVVTGKITWDGKNEHGALVAGGSYLVRLQANGLDEVRRLSVMR